MVYRISKGPTFTLKANVLGSSLQDSLDTTTTIYW